MFEAQLPGQLKIVDSHTAGEPTRCVLDGLPDLGSGPLAERLEHLRNHHDHLRRAILCEPRGSDVLVGAYLVAAGQSNVGNRRDLLQQRRLPGHVRTRNHRRRRHARASWPHPTRRACPRHACRHRCLRAAPGNRVTIRNVPAYRYRTAVTVEVPGFGPVTGDVAWGGNWFFLSEAHPVPLTLEHKDQLTDYTWAIRQGLASANITGADGAEIDHIEISSPPHGPANTAATSFSVPAKHTIARPAARAPAPNSPALPPRANCIPASPGVRKAFSAPSSKAASNWQRRNTASIRRTGQESSPPSPAPLTLPASPH